ncbi:MAG: carbohydrate kinase family protein [Bacteroidota bacterium]|nr:carbohydrate kinase family protein [Bacteroidota bacterium]MDP4190970.1 carbohydrate kinase family protein [Bacteroidota bacterium]MDP4195109.1 carbohydrate kinase family protein [Bacteroidota bacterium]
MRLLLIGHSVEDQIHLENREIHSPGGIFYSAMGLNSFLSSKDELFLLTSYDDLSYPLFSSLYDTLKKDYFLRVNSIPKVHLYISANCERCETYENLAEPLNLSKIENLDQFDGILINMITGSDIKLSDMLNIRKNYKGLIYFDVHTLSRGVDENNRRYFRPIPDAQKWISSVDIIQANENELRTLSCKNKELDIVEDILQFGLKILIVTKGEQGSVIYWKEGPKLNFFPQSAISSISINKVGCGDIFGAAFFYSFVSNAFLPDAAKLANIASGCITNYSDIKDLVNLRNDTFSRFN